MHTLVIIPTYNESGNIEAIVKAVLGTSSQNEVLIVDDNSPDGTADIVETLSEHETRLHLIRRSKKNGLGTAYVAGFRYAIEHGYDCVVEMDADFSHDPKDIVKFHEALNDADVVVGSRYAFGVSVLNWPMKRLLLSYAGNLFARYVTGVPVCDMTSGFKAFRIEALKKIDLDSVRSNGYAFQVEMNVRAFRRGLKIKEVPIVFTERRVGVSKMSKKIVLEAVKIVLILGIGRIIRFLKMD